HRLQGGGFLGNAFVHYGLGNFAFFARDTEAARTGVLRLTVDDPGVVESRWVPGRIGSGRLPAMLDGGEALEALAHWHGLRECAGLSAERP
ncbi:MAG: CapA family protein, partial [Actinomycetota bacterium]|nr:CapA family protein [Actinomycetota bacterium]